MKTRAVGERKVLHRIQIWLFVGHMISFLVFELVLGSATYVVMKYHTMQNAYAVIGQEWVQKRPEALHTLHADVDGQHVPPPNDAAPEMITTWIVGDNGQVLKKDQRLQFAPGSLTQALRPIVQTLNTAHANAWKQVSVGGTPILVGVLTVHNKQGAYIGAMVSAYSLGPGYEALRDLFRVIVDIGFGSIPFVAAIAVWLSHRSSRPIRTAMERQRAFVNDAAHELRTPLTILRGTLELLTDEQDPAEIRRSVEASLQEVDTLASLVSDLSTLARLESGALAVDIGPVDVAAVILQVVEQARTLADPRGITLSASGCDQPLWTQGDPLRLRQLFMILVQNGVKYNRPDGRVSVRLQKTPHHGIEVTVEDTGIGISAEDLPHIFDRFYRGRSGRNFAPGSGIGLAVAAWIVERHHGTISVSSTEQVGTTLTVLLP